MNHLVSTVLSQPCGGCGIPLHRSPQTMAFGICEDCLNRLPRVTEKICKICANPIMSSEERCWRCMEQKHPLDALYSLYFFIHPMTNIIHMYKKYARRDLINYLALQLHEILQNRKITAPLLPIPCLPKNKKKRGFDPVAVLCQHLKKQYGYHVVPCIQRKSGSAQKKLDFHQRQRSLHKKMYIVKKMLSQLPPRCDTVLLVDDVCTTGATLATCARLIKDCNIDCCMAISLARTIDY